MYTYASQKSSSIQAFWWQIDNAYELSSDMSFA